MKSSTTLTASRSTPTPIPRSSASARRPPVLQRGARLLRREPVRGRRAGNRRPNVHSGGGGIIEFIKADIPHPAGILIFEDPPIHDIHRQFLSRIFTPRRSPARSDRSGSTLPVPRPARRQRKLDFVDRPGAMPMKTISMLLGIPEEDQEAIREHGEGQWPEAGKPMRHDRTNSTLGDVFADYIDWRVEQPVRRPHDRTDQHRVRGRDRNHPDAHPRRVLTYSTSSPAPATRPPTG